MPKKKFRKSQMDKLRSNLRYWQMYGRIYRRWVRGANDKVREIAAEMRALQRGNDAKKI